MVLRATNPRDSQIPSVLSVQRSLMFWVIGCAWASMKLVFILKNVARNPRLILALLGRGCSIVHNIHARPVLSHFIPLARILLFELDCTVARC